MDTIPAPDAFVLARIQFAANMTWPGFMEKGLQPRQAIVG